MSAPNLTNEEEEWMMFLFSTSENKAASHSVAPAASLVASSSGQKIHGTSVSQEPKANHKEASIVKKKNMFDFLLPPPGMDICKPCQPGEGLTLGGRHITLDELMVLSPDELDEHALMQHGQPVPLGQLIELLEMPEEFLSVLEDERETEERTNNEEGVNTDEIKDTCESECCDLKTSCSG